MEYKERIIEVLKQIAIKANVYGIECTAMDVAVNAIKQQMPEKPKIITTEYFGIGGNIHTYDSTYCPCCNTPLGLKNISFKFCYNCGKAIDNEVDE